MISNTEVIRMMQVTSSNEGADGDGRGGDDFADENDNGQGVHATSNNDESP